MALVNILDLVAFLDGNATSDLASNPILVEVRDAAEEHVATMVGPLEGAAGVAYTVRSTSKYLRIPPAQRLTAVTAITDPTGTAVTVADCDVDLAAGVVKVPYQRDGAWTITVTTTDAPAAVALAVKIIAKHLWETKRGNRGAAPAVYAQNPEATVPMGYAIPARAAELLSPYLLPGFA